MGTLRLIAVALLVAGATAAQAAPAAGERLVLRARWPMDERHGAVMHDVRGRHDGRLHHVRVGLRGWRGHAYGFNGVSSAVVVPHSRALTAGSRPVRFSLHVRLGQRPRRGHDYDLLRNGTGARRGMYKAEIWSDGRLTCRFKGLRGDARIHAGPSLSDRRWHRVGCLRTRGRITLVVDGRRWSRRARVGRIVNRSPVVLGAVPGDDWFLGRIDGVSISIGRR